MGSSADSSTLHSASMPMSRCPHLFGTPVQGQSDEEGNACAPEQFQFENCLIRGLAWRDHRQHHREQANQESKSAGCPNASASAGDKDGIGTLAPVGAIRELDRCGVHVQKW